MVGFAAGTKCVVTWVPSWRPPGRGPVIGDVVISTGRVHRFRGAIPTETWHFHPQADGMLCQELEGRWQWPVAWLRRIDRDPDSESLTTEQEITA